MYVVAFLFCSIAHTVLRDKASILKRCVDADFVSAVKRQQRVSRFGVRYAAAAVAARRNIECTGPQTQQSRNAVVDFAYLEHLDYVTLLPFSVTLGNDVDTSHLHIQNKDIPIDVLQRPKVKYQTHSQLICLATACTFSLHGWAERIPHY
jgi:hypothetical protein